MRQAGAMGSSLPLTPSVAHPSSAWSTLSGATTVTIILGMEGNGLVRTATLVVLSASETGVGDVSFYEGLSGLQRSLALAGERAPNY
jgi:CHAT domain-containing protein